jgi:hypothetical protein
VEAVGRGRAQQTANQIIIIIKEHQRAIRSTVESGKTQFEPTSLFAIR